MRVVGLEPHSDHVLVVVVEGVSGEKPEITYYDTFAMGDEDRATGLRVIRTRVHGLVDTQKPDLVVVKPLENQAIEPRKRKFINMSWFEGAEVRGVVMEAARAAEAPTEPRDGATVTRTIGARKGKDYASDDGFWTNEVLGKKLSNKKYRPVGLMAISALREHLA